MLQFFELSVLLSTIIVSTANLNKNIMDTSPLLLRGSPEGETSKIQVSFQVWANPGKSALKPRKQDLQEPNLMILLGGDYDHRWMRTNKDKPIINVSIKKLNRKTKVKYLIGNVKLLTK